MKIHTASYCVLFTNPKRANSPAHLQVEGKSPAEVIGWNETLQTFDCPWHMIGHPCTTYYAVDLNVWNFKNGRNPHTFPV